jgi:hypothetical protein
MVYPDERGASNNVGFSHKDRLRKGKPWWDERLKKIAVRKLAPGGDESLKKPESR